MIEANTTNSIILPIYIDISIMLDLLASIEGGFSVVQKEATSNLQTEVSTEAKRSLNVEITTPFLKLGVAPTKDSSSEDEISKTTILDRYQTYGSLLFRLRNMLHEKKLIKQFENTEDSWDLIKVSDFVELHGSFQPNPLIESLSSLDRLITMISLFTPTTKESTHTRGKNTSQTNKNNTSKINNSQIQKFFNGIKEDISPEGLHTFVIHLSQNRQHSALVSIFEKYLRDQSLTEITGGEFHIIGKVVRKLKNDEQIDLLGRGTGLGSLDTEKFDQLMSPFEKLGDSGFQFPKIERYISYPALQIVPIAIFV